MKITAIATLPLQALQILSTAKSFDTNSIIGSRRLNRLGLHTARVRQAARMAERRRHMLSRFVDSEQCESFSKSGFFRIENFLPEQTFSNIQREIELDFDRFDMIQGSAVTRMGMIDDIDLQERPGLRAARRDPRMLRLIRYAASHGGQPLVTLQAVFANPTKQASADDPQTIVHADTFHATAKAWLFLHDVGQEDGPFTFVPGSHEMTPQRYEWERELAIGQMSDRDVYSRRGSLRVSISELKDLGYVEPLPITVKANTLVVADTHGFHARSISPRKTSRLEIYSYMRRNPFTPWSGFHAASFPGVETRMNHLMMSGLQTLERLHIKRSPWQHAGSGRMDEWPILLD